MHKGRLEAFSDGVIAILITIMVLSLKVPAGWQLDDLRETLPTLCAYALSFVILGIYWNNHHHMFQITEQVNGAVMWANLHLLFWLSLVPFATNWMGVYYAAAVPTALYGVVLICAACSYTLLQTTIIRAHGGGSRLATAVGSDAKGKISIVAYACAVLLAFVRPWIADALYAAVALVWLVPDRRIESRLHAPSGR